MFALLGRLWGGRLLHRGGGLEVRERSGLRTLHLESDTVQSAMRIDAPDELELSYTRAMMAFLLFAPPPRSALLIGLGGGSIAKFMFRRLLQTQLQVIELHPQVVAVARQYFSLPDDGPRLRVQTGEGAAHVRSHKAHWDLMLVDAYDGQSLAPSLATEQFFADAHAALSSGGMFAMNLWSSDRAFERNVQKIKRAFSGRCLCLPAERPGNVIVFGFRGVPEHLAWSDLRTHADALEKRLGLEFPRFVERLRESNLGDAEGLLLDRGGL